MLSVSLGTFLPSPKSVIVTVRIGELPSLHLPGPVVNVATLCVLGGVVAAPPLNDRLVNVLKWHDAVFVPICETAFHCPWIPGAPALPTIPEPCRFFFLAPAPTLTPPPPVTKLANQFLRTVLLGMSPSLKSLMHEVNPPPSSSSMPKPSGSPSRHA